MDVRLKGNLSGAVVVPPSKSQAHRMLISAALGSKECNVSCSALNDDLVATMNCLNSLGAHIVYEGGCFKVYPIELKKNGLLDCGESGSTLRFLLSVAAVLGADATFVGSGKLPQRPNGALLDVLSQHGVVFHRHEESRELPLTCEGMLCGGSYQLSGSLSSQYLTGLLFALPLASNNSEIELTGNITSASYIEMTLDTLRIAGVEIKRRGRNFYINGNQSYKLPARVTVEGDWSSAAFWLVAGVVGNHPVKVCGIAADSVQGDRCVIDHLRNMGAFIEEHEDGFIAFPSQLFGTELDCMDTPDLLPILSVAASVADGETLFTNVGRLRYKESDRLAAMQTTLATFGIDSRIGEDTFSVYGGKASVKGEVDSFGDHRIAMSAAILATLVGEEVVINGAECVAKSYPRFFEDYAALGGLVLN
ncbi:MAG: 3-phosphoshikimate 1-carboxyvinyltransferase [Bacteroidaceae bacterium]|nr:3-phosphoshikimate 1-carboxyvinyltransferase [Bacteroidaceae bacterium]